MPPKSDPLSPHNSPSIMKPRSSSSSSPQRSPSYPHASPRNQALKLGGRSGFKRFIGHDDDRPQHEAGPDTVPYDSQAGAPIADSGGTYESSVDGIANPGEAVTSGFSLKPYTSK